MSSSEAEAAFLASAREAFRRDPGIASLDALGVWDLLGELADCEARAAHSPSGQLQCKSPDPYTSGRPGLASSTPGRLVLVSDLDGRRAGLSRKLRRSP